MMHGQKNIKVKEGFVRLFLKMIIKIILLLLLLMMMMMMMMKGL